MLLFENLTDENFLLYAAKYYYKPSCIDAEEFYEDLKRFKYLKRLINRYQETGVLSERLMLNHIIIIFNVFGIKPGLKMLEFKFDSSCWPILKPFLVMLSYIRYNQYTNVKMDQNVIAKLRQI